MKLARIFMILSVLWMSINLQADILREYWTGIPGASVSDLTASADYPDHPTASDLLSSFETPTNWAQYYGTRVRGYITAPATGDYIFWIASDDNSQLWLSTDADPGNATLIAQVTEWTDPRQWFQFASQKSAPVPLAAGKKYFVEALQKEHEGGDNLAVGWSRPGQSTMEPSEVVPGSALSPWNGYDPAFNYKPVVAKPGDYFLAEAPATLQLTATVQDDGQPLPANPVDPQSNDPHKLRWYWSVVSVPAGSQGVVWSGAPNSGEAFTYAGSPNLPRTEFTCTPTATFDLPGLYELQFNASDGEKSTSKPVTVYFKSTGVYRQKGYRYLSPLPGSEYTAANTSYFLVRFDTARPQDLTNLQSFITVTGNSSGNHSGQSKIASDGRTVIFKVSAGFSARELVTVSLNPTLTAGASGTVQPFQYQFAIAGPMPGAAADPVAPAMPVPAPEAPAPLQADTLSGLLPAGASGARIMPNGVSVPGDFPHINITINDNPDSNYIFLDNRGGSGQPWNVIFDNSGSPVWYSKMPDERRDMKVQPDGTLTMLARSGGHRFVGLNQNYQQVRDYWAVNGHSTDEHELVVQEDGRYLLIGLHHENVDMTRYLAGANTNATVGETVIQEFTPSGDLIFQWRAWDHFDVRDLALDNPYGGSFRFPHMNAIDIDLDDHIILSCRHINEVTKINRDTGEIIWRLGGAHSDFTFVNDPLNGFTNQHAARVTGPNRILLFDNGDLHSPQLSRACEYQLDLASKTATLVWTHRENPDVYAHYMGNTQRLANGNTLINWAIGSLPKLTEVRPDGSKAFEMNWVNQYEAYRVWRCPWQGKALKPMLIAEPQNDNVTLIFNQFGDPDVAYYRIYGGTSSQSATLLDTSTVTLKRLNNLTNGQRYYFRVTAVSKTGIESDYSNEESLVVNIVKPGQNMVKNGDFSQLTEGWTWTVSGTAAATWTIVDGMTRITITAPGSSVSSIQLLQAGILLQQGASYLFEFDAWSDQPRTFEAKVGQNVSPFTNYSRIGISYLTPQKKHFKFIFAMQESTDSNARVVFNSGTALPRVFLDNISVKMISPADFNQDGFVGTDDLTVPVQNWLKNQSGLPGDLDGNQRIDLRDIAILSGYWTGKP